jgi:hypothetical protein
MSNLADRDQVASGLPTITRIRGIEIDLSDKPLDRNLD